MNEASPLRNIRKLNGFSLQDVCVEVGVDHSHLSRIERGEKTSAVLAERLSSFFKNEISEIEILYPERYITIPQQ
jgi:putative transcriptional regulator|tara:strand:- start:2758 stop:2982 length:225 start_codon:yes stop_codon:yes gene_type:complete